MTCTVVDSFTAESADIDFTGRDVQDGDLLIIHVVSSDLDGASTPINPVYRETYSWSSVYTSFTVIFKLWRTGDSLSLGSLDRGTGQVCMIIRGADPDAPLHLRPAPVKNATGVGQVVTPLVEGALLIGMFSQSGIVPTAPSGWTNVAGITSGRTLRVAYRNNLEKNVAVPAVYLDPASGTMQLEYMINPQGNQVISPRNLGEGISSFVTTQAITAATLTGGKRTGERMFAVISSIGGTGTAGTTGTMVDSKSGTWTKKVQASNRHIALWERTSGAALTSGDTVTATITHSQSLAGVATHLTVFAVGISGEVIESSGGTTSLSVLTFNTTTMPVSPPVSRRNMVLLICSTRPFPLVGAANDGDQDKRFLQPFNSVQTNGGFVGHLQRTEYDGSSFAIPHFPGTNTSYGLIFVSAFEENAMKPKIISMVS